MRCNGAAVAGAKIYNLPADDCALREGRLESSIIPLDETLAIMNTLDTIRKQWGLRYPDV